MDKHLLSNELKNLSNWKLEKDYIVRVIPMHNWKGVMMLANAIAHLAEKAWHHPDLILTFSSITVKLSSHDVGAITQRDIALAKKIDELVEWNVKDDCQELDGTPDDPEFRYIKFPK